MSSERVALPVLWIYGPSGIGKTTAAWQLYRTGALSGADIALVEPELTALLFPEPEHGWDLSLITDNLAGMLANLRASSVQGVIVTSVAETRTAADEVATRLPDVSLTVCRLRASTDEHTRRYSARGYGLGALQQHLSEAAALDTRGSGDFVIDVTGLDVPETARAVLTGTGWSPLPPPAALAAARAARGEVAKASGQVPLLWLCGPRGSGKTSQGYAIASRLGRSGTKTAYVDAEHLSFFGNRDPSNAARVRAGNLAAVWQGYRAAGVQSVVVSGHPDDVDVDVGVLAAYGDAVPGAAWHVCRLDAPVEVLHARLVQRARSQTGVGLPEPLRHLSDDEIFAVAKTSKERWDAIGLVDSEHGIDTSEVARGDVASQALELLARPSG